VAPALLAQGLSEVATGYLLMTPVGAEMDDVTIGLDVESGLRLSFIGSLTERGQAVVQAGLKSAGKPPRPVHPDPVLSAWTGLDISAMLQAAPTPAAFEGPDRKKDVTMQLMVCGYFCYLHYLLRNPFGLVKTALEMTGPAAFDRLPRGFGFAITEIAGKQADDAPMRIAAAALFPAGTDLGFIQQAFTFSHPEDARRFKVTTKVKPQGESQLMLFGLNADPEQVFGQSQLESPADLIGEFELDLHKAARGLGFNIHSSEVYALLGKLDRLRLRSMFGGRSVQGELLVSLKGETPLGFAEILDSSSLSWDSPGAREADTKGRRCLTRHTRKMIEAYSALAAVSANYRVPVLQAAFQECKPSLDCALGEPDTRDEAQRMKFAQGLYLAGRMGEQFMPERKLELLDQTCKLGSKQACELAKEAREKPDLRLVRTDADCLPEDRGWNPVIRISPGKDPVDLGPESRERPRIAVDQAVTFERFRSVVDKLAGRGHRRVHILVRNSKDQVRWIPLKLPETDEPRERPRSPLRIGTGPEGMCYVGQGHEMPRTYKNVEALAEDLAAVVKKEGVVPYIEFSSMPEVTFDRVVRVLAVSTCAQGKDIDYVVSLARPITGLLKKLTGPHGTLQDVLKDAGVKSPTAGFGGFEHLHGKKRPIIKSKPPIPIVGHSMVKPMIRKVISKARPKIRRCYERCLLKDPNLEGTVKVHFVVGSTGRVTEAKITRNTSGSKELADCLLARVKQLKFPKPSAGGKMVVDYPFIFKSKKPKKKK
jgi:TonB family protein